MTSSNPSREAFEAQLIEEGRKSRLHEHPLHPGIYADNETTRRYHSFQAGMKHATAHLITLLQSEGMVDIAADGFTNGHKSFPNWYQIPLDMKRRHKAKAALSAIIEELK